MSFGSEDHHYISGETCLANQSNDEFGLSVDQIQQLEEVFKYCSHPKNAQKQQLSMELGIEPLRIKYWFKNRRMQQEIQNNRARMETLRAENAKLQSVNIVLREAVGDVKLPSEDEMLHEYLRAENVMLKQEIERFRSLLASRGVETERCIEEDVIPQELWEARVRDLNERMVKSFCKHLDNKYKKVDDPHLSDTCNDGVYVGYSHMPSGVVVMASSTLQLGLSPEALYNFFDDEKKRYQRDFYTGASSIHFFRNISSEAQPKSRLSIFQPSHTGESPLLLHHSFRHPLGSVFIYAPVGLQLLNYQSRADPPCMHTFSSVGFSISGGVGHSDSVLTAVSQKFIGHCQDMKVIAAIGAALASTITTKMMDIKNALSC